jgi:putative phage-type endonuclease
MSNFTHERFFSLKDQNLNEPSQRSPEWFARRRHKLSGSKLSQFLFCNSKDGAIQFYEEVFESRKKEPFTEEQLGWMKWGSEHEDGALLEFLNRKSDIMAYEAPHVQHNTVPWLSATPDGFYQIFDEESDDLRVLDEGILEIKCPAKTKKCNTRVTYYYVPQMYLEMACSDKSRAIFISWGPKRLRAWKLEWDDAFWSALSKMMDTFHRLKSGATYEEFCVCQMELRRACHQAVDAATPMGDWKL